MRSRSLIAIVVLGIGAMIAFGMATKIALDSNGQLRRITEFKVAFLDAFGGRGVEEVSFRWLPRGEGAMLRLVVDPRRLEGVPYLHDDIAEYVLQKLPAVGYRLTLSYLAPRGLGCSGSEAYLVKEIDLGQVRRAIRAREQKQHFAEALRTANGARLEGLERADRTVHVTVSRGEEASPKDPPGEFLEQVALETSRFLRVVSPWKIRVTLLAPLPSGVPTRQGAREGEDAPKDLRAVAEGYFDFRARPLQR